MKKSYYLYVLSLGFYHLTCGLKTPLTMLEVA